LKKLLATTRCGAAMADGVASTIPSLRPTGARSGLSEQLAQSVQSASAGGETSITLAKKFASKTTPFCSQWRASSQRAPNRRKLLERDRGSFAGLYSHYYVLFFGFLLSLLVRSHGCSLAALCLSLCLFPCLFPCLFLCLFRFTPVPSFKHKNPASYDQDCLCEN